jgi:hypothetical protein
MSRPLLEFRIVRVWRTAWLEDERVDEHEVVEALQRLDPLWDQLFPAEQAHRPAAGRAGGRSG